MKKLILVSLVGLVLLTALGCAPSESAVQTALAETQAALPTETPTLAPTATATQLPTATNTPEPTETPTATPTATPDTRVITMDSRDFLMSKDDIPPEGKYILPNSAWISVLSNDDIIRSWGREEGLEYLDKTGRIYGWAVYYYRTSKTVRAPEEIWHNVIQYKTAEGAQLTVGEFSTAKRVPEYKIVEENYPLGDMSVIMIVKTLQDNGEYRITYRIETAYKNYVSIVGAWGWEKEYDLDFVIGLAETMLAKLQSAPLGEW